MATQPILVTILTAMSDDDKPTEKQSYFVPQNKILFHKQIELMNFEIQIANVKLQREEAKLQLEKITLFRARREVTPRKIRRSRSRNRQRSRSRQKSRRQSRSRQTFGNHDRSCYFCGSRSHLIKRCPEAYLDRTPANHTKYDADIPRIDSLSINDQYPNTAWISVDMDPDKLAQENEFLFEPSSHKLKTTE